MDRPVRLLVRPERRANRGVRVLASFLLIAGLVAAAGAAVARAGFFSTERRSIERMSMGILSGFASNDFRAALKVCAEGEWGRGLIQQEEARVFRGTPPVRNGSETEREESLHALHQILTQSGASWSDVRPLAFGGIRARVEDVATMSRPLTVLTGGIFFESADRVFAIELSAWRCNGEYVVVDVWKATELQGGRAGIQPETDRIYRAFQQESDEQAGLKITYPKTVFVEF